MKAIKSIFFGTALAVTPVAAGGLLAAEPMISDIDVSADFSAVDDANALEFWPDLEADLEAALAEELSGRMADDGGRLQVIVNDVSVDGSAILTGDGTFNSISGGVFLYPEEAAGDGAETPFTTSVTVVGVPDMPDSVSDEGPDFLILPSDATVYDVMLEKFAEVVLERLPTM